MTFHSNEPKKIILTGGSGFLGGHLLKNKLFEKALVIGRSKPKNHKHFKEVLFSEEENLSKIFRDVEVISSLQYMKWGENKSLWKFIEI